MFFDKSKKNPILNEYWAKKYPAHLDFSIDEIITFKNIYIKTDLQPLKFKQSGF